VQNYYQILGVSVSATEAEIKTAFKKLAIQYHPDKNPGSKFHEEHFKKVSEAYENLIDSEKRTVYDLKLVFGMMDETPTRPTAPRTYAPPPPVYRGTQAGRPQYRKAPPETGETIKNEGFTNFQKIGNILIVVACLVMLGAWVYSLRSRYSAENYLKMGNYEMALSYDSSNSVAWYKLGIRAYENNDLPNADLYLQKAMEFSANPELILFFQYGKILERRLKYTEAISYYQKVTQTNPGFDSVWFRIGYVQTTKKPDYSEAITNFNKALVINPYFFDCYVYKAVAEINSGNFEASNKTIDIALGINPKIGYVYYLRALSNLAQGDTSTACTDFSNAVSKGYKKAKSEIDSYCTPKSSPVVRKTKKK